MFTPSNYLHFNLKGEELEAQKRKRSWEREMFLEAEKKYIQKILNLEKSF